MTTESTALQRPIGAGLPPWLLVVTAIVSVQVGAAFAKGLFDAAGSSGVVFLRTFLGGLILVALVRPRLRGHGAAAYRFMIVYGVTIAVNMLTFYAAIDRIPLGVAVAIAFCGPLSLSVIGSRRALDLLWVVLAVIGILLLSPITDSAVDPLGVGLAFVCAGAWATFILVTKRAGSLLPGNTMLAFAMCLAAFASAPFGLVGAFGVLAQPSLIGLALLVALLSSVVPFVLEFTALRHLSPRVFGLLMSLEPAVAALVGWALLGETLGREAWIGIALVTTAAAATARSTH
jgi:inner membrane transporter RhtA